MRAPGKLGSHSTYGCCEWLSLLPVKTQPVFRGGRCPGPGGGAGRLAAGPSSWGCTTCPSAGSLGRPGVLPCQECFGYGRGWICQRNGTRKGARSMGAEGPTAGAEAQRCSTCTGACTDHFLLDELGAASPHWHCPSWRDHTLGCLASNEVYDLNLVLLTPLQASEGNRNVVYSFPLLTRRILHSAEAHRPCV